MKDSCNYWDGVNQRRVTDNAITANKHKLSVIKQLLLDSGTGINVCNKNILDVGCGIPVIPLITEYCYKSYDGIDISHYACKFCSDNGINCVKGNILEYETTKKYGCFMFWDSMEHIEDRTSLRKKIIELGEEKIWIVGNVPIDSKNHNEFDYPVSLRELYDFMAGLNMHNGYVKTYKSFKDKYTFFSFNNEM